MTAPVPLTAAELADYRYRDIVAVVAAQNEALAEFSRYLQDWQANLTDLTVQVQALAARVSRLESTIEGWAEPMPAEDRIDAAARDAEAAREEVCMLTDLISFILPRVGVAIPPGLTLEEIHQFVAKNPGPGAGDPRREAVK